MHVFISETDKEKESNKFRIIRNGGVEVHRVRVFDPLQVIRVFRRRLLALSWAKKILALSQGENFLLKSGDPSVIKFPATAIPVGAPPVNILKAIYAGRAKRTIAESLVATAILALLTESCHRLHINVATCALLYVIVVAITSRVGTFGTAIVVSVVASLGLAYFAPPNTLSRLTTHLTSWPSSRSS